MQTEFYIPNLHSFDMENVFSGSSGSLRFVIKPSVVKFPNKEIDRENSSLKVEIWHGLFCYEKSTIDEERVFPLTMEGRQNVIDWLVSLIANV